MNMSSIKAIKTHIIDATFYNKVPDIPKIPGLTILAKNDNKLSLKVQGNINGIIQILAKYDLSNLEINHATLEEIFMDYYKIKS